MKPTRAAAAGSGTCPDPRTWQAQASWPRRVRRPAEPRTPCSRTLHTIWPSRRPSTEETTAPRETRGDVGLIPRAIGETREKEAGGRWSGMAALRQHPRTHRLVSSGGTSSPISSSATTAAAAREGSDRCGRRLRSCLGFLGEGDEPRNASRAKEGEDTGASSID